jgi:hypothetical protein
MRRLAVCFGACVMLVLGSLAVANPASAAPGDTQTIVFGRGTDDAVWYRVRDEASGGAWQPWRTLGGAVTGTPYGELMPDGRIAVFARGVDGAVWTRTSWDAVSWSPWTTLGGYILDDPAVISVPWDTNPGEAGLMVFGRGPDERIWMRSFVQSSGTWTGWRLLITSDYRYAGQPYGWADPDTRSVFVAGSPAGRGYPTTPGSALVQQLGPGGSAQLLIFGPDSDPSRIIDTPVLVNGAGLFVGFARDANQRLVGVEPPLQRWFDLGGLITHAPQFGPPIGDLVTALGRGADGAAWWWHSPNGWVGLGGLVRESPSSAYVSDNRSLLIARGVDDGVWIRWYDEARGTWSGWEGLGGLLRSAPSQLSTVEVG